MKPRGAKGNRPKTGAERVREFVSRAAEIGAPSAPKRPAEVRACAKDLLRFGYAYFRMADLPPGIGLLSRDPSSIVTDYVARLQDMILVGGRSSIAVPRGYGKTTWAKIATLWGLLYGHIHYAVLFASDNGKAKQIIADIRAQLESNDLLDDDFNAATRPVRALAGSMQRAPSQTMNGERTMLQLNAESIRLPNVESAPFCGGMVLSRGIGSGFLGLVKGGRRPDFALLDDVQSLETAESETEVDKIERAIQGGVIALGGHDRPISVLMTCTCVRPGDLSDRYLDADLHPEFRPIRHGLVIRWPNASEMWEKYRELWQSDQRTGGTESSAFYAENRSEMDLGAIVSDDKLFDDRLEVSAIQHAYHALFTMGRVAFEAQMQNQPSRESHGYSLTVKDVASRVNRLARHRAPPSAGTIIAFSDINHDGIRWVTVAFCSRPGFVVVVDYGKYPQRGNLVPMNASEAEQQRRVFEGLRAVGETLKTTVILRGESRMALRAWSVDRGYKPEVVHAFTKQAHFGFPVMPSRGYAAKNYSPDFKGRVGEPGYQCHVTESPYGQFLATNADHWREVTQRACLVDPMSPGSCSFWGTSQTLHWELAEHICSEVLADKVTGPRGTPFYKWTKRPGVKNDYLDCLVGCYASGAWFRAFDAVATSEGVGSAEQAMKPARRKVRYRETRKCKVTAI